MEKVSLQSKSNTSLDPSSYPKDLDPFGDEDNESQLGQTIQSHEVIKPSAPDDPTYPGTLDPFADEEEEDGKGKETCENIESITNSNRSSKRISTLSYQEKDPNNVITNSNGDGIIMETSITSRASDYDESLDPFGDDDGVTTVGKTKPDERKSIVDAPKELRKPAIVEPSAVNRLVTNDNLSIKSETESSSSGEILRRGGEERNSYSNQNSPVPVPPRRKHRNVSPSTKSLNRASYSASSLEREPTNVISSPSSPDPNHLSTVENDSYLSHSTSNLSIRSTSPITTVRSSPIRSRKKRRAPDPPGLPPTAPSTVTSPAAPDISLASTDADTSMETTIGSIKEMISDTLNEPKDEASNEIPLEATPEPTPEPKSEPCNEPTEESNNETPIEPNLATEIETEREDEKEKEEEKEKEKPTDEPTATSSEATSDKAQEPESRTYSPTSSDSTADTTEKHDIDQSKSHQDPSNL